jgi:hypothetical protein
VGGAIGASAQYPTHSYLKSNVSAKVIDFNEPQSFLKTVGVESKTSNN